MPRGKHFLCSLLFVILACWPAEPALAQSPRPKVRAITAFIRLDPVQYQRQVADTLKMLRAAKAEYQRAGYEVESVRITTQPFPQFIAGMSDADALAWFRAYDELSLKESFDANLGPAMLTDSDDPHPAELLAKVLSETRNLAVALDGAATTVGMWKMCWSKPAKKTTR